MDQKEQLTSLYVHGVQVVYTLTKLTCPISSVLIKENVVNNWKCYITVPFQPTMAVGLLLVQNRNIHPADVHRMLYLMRVRILV